ncbi:MAG TPA: PAS domain-containing protein, partial [Methylomirabilota bacterium]|nr:PAS domain-containing protein [Methylomirabilota bacterium]
MISGSVNWLLLLSTAGANLCVGAYTLSRSPRAPLNRAFTFLALTTSGWAAALAFGYHTDPSEQGFGNTTTIIRVAFAAGSLFAVAFLIFIDRFASITRRDSQIIRRGLAPIGVGFFFLSFTSWIASSAKVHDDVLTVTYGPLHPAFALYALIGLGTTIYLLAKKHRLSEGLEAIQVRYVILAFVLSGALITTTNVVLPLVLKTSAYGRYGPLFSLILLGIIGHAIIRHRLMDIRLVIHRGATYLGAVGIAAGTITLVLIAANRVLPDEHDFSLREILLSAVVVFLLNPVRAIQHFLDRYVYRNPYDYAHTLRNASDALTDTIDLEALLTHTADVIDETFHPDSVSIYLMDLEDYEYVLAWSRAAGSLPKTLSTDAALFRELAIRPLLFSDDLRSREPTDHTRDLAVFMTQHSVEVALPLREEGATTGCILIGAKRSGDPYFSNDVDLLSTLANQVAVAVRNAQTHTHVVQMNEQLQTILQTIESGVVAVGRRGRITLFNRAAERLTGTASRLAHGASPRDLPAPLSDLLQATASDGEARSQIEFTLPNQARRPRPLICSTLPIHGPQGTILGAVAVLSDISRLKELEQEKRRAERLASIEAITSGLIHEIRNPLVSMKTYAQLLPSRWDDEEFRNKLSRTTSREIERIDALLSRFRTVSRATALPMVPVEIVEPIQDVLETLHAQMEEQHIRLRQVGTAAGRTVLGNVSQLQQLFLNL